MSLIPTDLGTNSSTASGTTVAVTVTDSAAVGDTVLVAFALRRNDRTLSTVVDSAGNTYTIDKTQAAATNVGYVALARSVLTTALTSGVSTITATFSGTATTSVRMIAAAKVTAAALTADQNASAAHAATTAWNTGNTPQTTVADELLFGVACSDDTTTSTAGSSTTELHDFTSNVLILTTVYRILTVTGTYAASGTFIASGNGAECVVTYSAVAAASSKLAMLI